MSYMKKPFEELDVIDDFMMNAVATDPEVGEAFCRKLLSVLLQRTIGGIKVSVQRTIPALAPGYRGIRIDVEVEEMETACDEDGSVLNIYDIEPHKNDKQQLPRRNRFYQAKLDSRYLKRGEKDFGKLPNLYVITIMNYDPFGADYMMYTVRNKCEEVPELDYEDGLQFIYFNTEGNKGGNEEIRNLLTYIKNSKECNVKDETTREIHEYMNRVRVQPEVKGQYMTVGEIIDYERMNEKKCNILELLEDYGELPDSAKKRLDVEVSDDVLKRWLKLAAKVNSMEEFVEQM